MNKKMKSPSGLVVYLALLSFLAVAGSLYFIHTPLERIGICIATLVAYTIIRNFFYDPYDCEWSLKIVHASFCVSIAVMGMIIYTVYNLPIHTIPISPVFRVILIVFACFFIALQFSPLKDWDFKEVLFSLFFLFLVQMVFTYWRTFYVWVPLVTLPVIEATTFDSVRGRRFSKHQREYVITCLCIGMLSTIFQFADKIFTRINLWFSISIPVLIVLSVFIWKKRNHRREA